MNYYRRSKQKAVNHDRFLSDIKMRMEGVLHGTLKAALSSLDGTALYTHMFGALQPLTWVVDPNPKLAATARTLGFSAEKCAPEFKLHNLLMKVPVGPGPSGGVWVLELPTKTKCYPIPPLAAIPDWGTPRLGLGKYPLPPGPMASPEARSYLRGAFAEAYGENMLEAVDRMVSLSMMYDRAKLMLEAFIPTCKSYGAMYYHLPILNSIYNINTERHAIIKHVTCTRKTAPPPPELTRILEVFASLRMALANTKEEE